MNAEVKRVSCSRDELVDLTAGVEFTWVAFLRVWVCEYVCWEAGNHGTPQNRKIKTAECVMSHFGPSWRRCKYVKEL